MIYSQKNSDYFIISSSSVHKIWTLIAKHAQRLKGKLSTVNANTELKFHKITVNRLMRNRLNDRIPYFHTYERESKHPVNIKYSVQYTLLLLYLMLVMCTEGNLSIKLYRIYVCYTNITLYIAFDIISGFT